MRRQGRRVVTPNGYVWFVRRRRARRRAPWARRPPGQGLRFHGEEEVPAEAPAVQPWSDLWRFPNLEVGERGFDRFNDDRHAAVNAVQAAVIGVLAAGVLAWLTVRYVLAWLVPLVQANARLLLGLAAALVVLAGLNQLHRPWYVELRRQGLADAPRRVWRVQGWRRSGRLMGELTAAIRDGRIDGRGAVILRQDPYR
ncbi:MAG TPA: hypothetical protein VHS79_02560 [Actinomycetes bacterium]|nr:hypothetical protein [Actinomycetes bacterium]HEX2155858.1 hypothetical protein [Actinomycetes bacterium]